MHSWLRLNFTSFALLLGLFSKPFSQEAVQILVMADDMETTGAWLPDKNLVLDITFCYIKAHIEAFYVCTSATADDKSFMSSFYTMLHQFKLSSDPM